VYRSKSIDLLLSKLIDTKLVYLFSSERNRLIHEEVKRQKRTLFRALTDYYRFGNTLERHIEDIIFDEVLNEEGTEKEVHEMHSLLETGMT